MNLPSVDILCPTYARTHLVCELLECFRRQTYTGAMRLVIYNDRSDQELSTKLPGVSIFNTSTPFANLGYKRQAMLEASSADLIQWWDDDDIFLPDHVERGVSKLQDGEPASRVSKEWRLSGGTLTREFSGGLRGVTFRRERLLAVGGVPLVQRGEWNALVPRLVQLGWFHGPHHCADDGAPTIIHRTDAAALRVTTSNSHREMSMDADKRQHEGSEPRGAVELIPVWDEDYTLVGRNFDKAAVSP